MDDLTLGQVIEIKSLDVYSIVAFLITQTLPQQMILINMVLVLVKVKLAW